MGGMENRLFLISGTLDALTIDCIVWELLPVTSDHHESEEASRSSRMDPPFRRFGVHVSMDS